MGAHEGTIEELEARGSIALDAKPRGRNGRSKGARRTVRGARRETVGGARGAARQGARRGGADEKGDRRAGQDGGVGARRGEGVGGGEGVEPEQGEGRAGAFGSVRRAGDGSNIAGSNPASAAASPLRPLDVNAEHRDGSTADEKRLEKRAEKRREEPPSTASSVENLPELLSSHAPSPARPRPAVAAAKVAANVETPREETKRHPCRLARETPRADADVAERRLAEIAAELDDLRPALASLQRALGSIEMKPTLDALRLGKRAPRPCEALAAILALSVTDPRLFDGQAPLTRDDVANALRAGDAFGI